MPLGRIRARPNCTVTCGPHPQCRRGPFAQCTRPTALPGRPQPALPATMRHCARHASAHRSGHHSPGARRGTAGGGSTVEEVEQGEVLEHPWRRDHLAGKWVEAAAHRSFLPTGRVEKPGQQRRSPMRWGLRWPAGSYIGVGRKRKLRRKCTQRKRRQVSARGSAHRGGVSDGGGGRTTTMARPDSDMVGFGHGRRHGRDRRV
jgi:hypothetical protein